MPWSQRAVQRFSLPPPHRHPLPPRRTRPLLRFTHIPHEILKSHLEGTAKVASRLNKEKHAVRAIEYVNRFARTVAAFWRLKPRDFVLATARHGGKFLSPYQFLCVFGSIGVIIYTSYFVLVSGVVQGTAEESIAPWARALAIRQLVLIVVSAVVTALYHRAISRVWPVRGSASFRSVLSFRIFFLSGLLPIAVLDLLVGPVLFALVARAVLPPPAVWLLVVVGFVVGVVLEVVKGVPGFAAMNGVSIARAWAGLIFWPGVVGVVVGAIGGLALALAEVL